MGPEIMKEPAAARITDQIKGGLMASLTDKITSVASDGCPQNISKIGKTNNEKFFPAGSCFKQVHHFHQLLNEGGFRKFRYSTPELNR